MPFAVNIHPLGESGFQRITQTAAIISADPGAQLKHVRRNDGLGIQYLLYGFDREVRWALMNADHETHQQAASQRYDNTHSGANIFAQTFRHAVRQRIAGDSGNGYIGEQWF
jgi:hypothetical protein